MRDKYPVCRVMVKTEDGRIVTKIVDYESVEEMYIIEESLGNTVVEYWRK